ncbi:glucosamine--fructose-6-phosphate aminotransferase [Escherichia coli O104:H4 str. 01-09591]|nr:glucosamine--fructose-6-phosphate aminotransferase [Escherichia coli O104:H4 str. 01-09591]
MCGIVGAIAQRDVAEILLEGLRRLEYRGYDSAGLAVVDAEGHMTRLRRLGKVQMLLRQRKNILCMAVRVLLILAGRPTVNLQK